MKTKRLVVSAMLLALATILSILQPFQLPFGGGITLASMMPIVILSYVYGVKFGLVSGFVYSLIQMLLGMRTVSAFFIPGESQMVLWRAVCVCLLDYVIAYTVLGFGGMFKKRLPGDYVAICLGSVVALALRYLVHVISGALFFGTWAEWFFTQDGFYAVGEAILQTFSGSGLAWMYSVFYNGLYMIPEIVLTTITTPIVYFSLKKSKLITETEE